MLKLKINFTKSNWLFFPSVSTQQAKMHVKVWTLWSSIIIIKHRIVINFNIILSWPFCYKSKILSSIVYSILTLFEIIRMSISGWPACFSYNDLFVVILWFQLPILINKRFKSLLRSYCISTSLWLTLPVRISPLPCWIDICSNKSASIC